MRLSLGFSHRVACSRCLVSLGQSPSSCLSHLCNCPCNQSSLYQSPRSCPYRRPSRLDHCLAPCPVLFSRFKDRCMRLSLGFSRRVAFLHCLVLLRQSPSSCLSHFLQLTSQRVKPLSVATELSLSSAEQTRPLPRSVSSFVFKVQGPMHALVSWIQSSGGVLALLGFAPTKSLELLVPLLQLTTQRVKPHSHPALSSHEPSMAIAVLPPGTCPCIPAPKPNLTILDLVWLLACALFSLCLVLQWGQSQRYIYDNDDNDDNFDHNDGSDDDNNNDGLAMIPQPPTASTNAGQTRRSRHRRTLPAAPLRRSPRLLAQQNAVPRRSARIAAQARKRATTARG
jgi:hypothetical protein